MHKKVKQTKFKNGAMGGVRKECICPIDSVENGSKKQQNSYGGVKSGIGWGEDKVKRTQT